MSAGLILEGGAGAARDAAGLGMVGAAVLVAGGVLVFVPSEEMAGATELVPAGMLVEMELVSAS